MGAAALRLPIHVTMSPDAITGATIHHAATMATIMMLPSPNHHRRARERHGVRPGRALGRLRHRCRAVRRCERHRRPSRDGRARYPEVWRLVDAVAVRRDARRRLAATKTPRYRNISAVEIRRSLPSEGRLSSVPSNAIVVDPPLSSAIPVTAPSRTSAWASSKFVSPTLYPGWRPSIASRTIRPSRELADGAARRARAQLPGRERLAGAEDRRAVANDLRAPADRSRRSRASSAAARAATISVAPERRLGRQRRRARAPRDEHRAARRDRDGRAVGARLDDGCDEVDVGRRAGNGKRTTATLPGIAGVLWPYAR